MTKTYGDNGFSSKAERDAFDLNNEMAGNETGRPRRFLSREKREELNGAAARRRHEAYSRLSAMLATDPEYAALYNDTSEKLDDAEAAANEALLALNEQIDALAADLEEMEDRAETLPDGTRVFRSADGRVFTEHGRELSPDETGKITWSKDAPSWEEYLAKKTALQKAAADRDAVLIYQRDVLDPARQRLEDEDNPPTRDELEQIQSDIENKVPGVVKAEMAPADLDQPGSPEPTVMVDVPSI